MASSTHPVVRKNVNFSSLPAELRLMIWKETIERRILHITSKTAILYRRDPAIRRSSDVIWTTAHTHVRFKAREDSPIALQICHESRTLALKHYTPSFLSTTSPLPDAGETNQTAIYFNPELDTVHIFENVGDKIHNLTQRTNRETIQSIKVLALEFSGRFLQAEARYLSRCLLVFKGLETVVLVFGWDAEFTRKIMEDALIEVHNRLRVEGACAEWKVPAVKVMNSRAFETHLWRARTYSPCPKSTSVDKNDVFRVMFT
jgi:hypothetical protein